MKWPPVGGCSFHGGKMILNTGSRTDIPAFFSQWMKNRLREGFVMARNPYYPKTVYRYELDPKTVDVIVFCTKNPRPMLDDMHLLDPFRQLWYVTLTPYGKDIEPNVPDKHEVIQSVIDLAEKTGENRVIWRYDPVFLNERYTFEYHIRAFTKIAEALHGALRRVVVSYIDLYEKTKKNFPEVREVEMIDQIRLTKAFADIAEANGMQVLLCLENPALADFGADVSGCMSQKVIEECIGEKLDVPHLSPARQGCSCLLGNDIGVYNTCMHFCRYCYANYDRNSVLQNQKRHDPESPLLIGNIRDDDQIINVRQVSYVSRQMRLDI